MTKSTSSLMESTAPARRRRRRTGDRSQSLTPSYLPPARSGALMLGTFALIAGGALALTELDDGPTDLGAVAAASVDQRGSTLAIAAELGVTEVWEQGITGEGVNVAVVDTGVASVDALRDRVVAWTDLTGEAVDTETAGVDTHGHGTHLAGIVAGHDPSTGFRGIAPDAGIVAVKVAGRDGTVMPSALVDGIHWVVDHADEHGVGVLLLAFDAAEASELEETRLLAAVERAWSAGIVVVTATGNTGGVGLSAPASSESAIAVAAVDTTLDTPAPVDFGTIGDGERRPDLAAPGAHVISLRAPGSNADLDHPEGFVDDERFLGTGTSQAAAVVAGLAALMLQAAPDASPDDVRAWLVESARPVGTPAETGAGMPWLPAAIDSTPLDEPWSGQGWSGQGWSGQGWSGQGWSGQGWSGLSWS